MSLLPAIQRILESWPALKSYLVSGENEDCPSIIWAFVCGATDAENVHGTVAVCVLAFMHNPVQEFDSSIRNLESDCATVIEVHSVMNRLRGQLISRRKRPILWQQSKANTVKTFTPATGEEFESLVGRFLEKAVQCLEDKFDISDHIIAHIACLQ